MAHVAPLFIFYALFTDPGCRPRAHFEFGVLEHKKKKMPSPPFSRRGFQALSTSTAQLADMPHQ